MARWIALLLASCAESIPVEKTASVERAEAPSPAEQCPVARPGPTFSPAGEPPCASEGQRCFYGALTCVCAQRDRFARWACVPDECLRDACTPGAKCDFGFQDSRFCDRWGRWITVERRAR